MIDRENGFVSPSSYSVTKNEFNLKSITESVGVSLETSKNKNSVELEIGLGSSQLLNATSALYLKKADGNYYHFTHLDRKELNKVLLWQYANVNYVRKLNTKMQLVAGLQSQLFFSSFNDKDMESENEPKLRKGFTQFNFLFSLRYKI